MRVLVLLNAKAGTIVASGGKDLDTRIRDRFATHGIDADVRDVPGPQLAEVTQAARESEQYDLIIAGGGDGTLNTVASTLVGSGVPFGVLPLGTFNYLARELGVPLELDPAIDALAGGHNLPFNVGEVNGRHFLLFAAIGLYTDMIWHRDAQRKALGRPKMWAGTIALVKMLARWPLMYVRIRNAQPPGARPDGGRITSVVYLTMSAFQMEQLGLLEVPADPREALNMLISRQVNRRGLVWQMIKGMLGRLTTGPDLELSRVNAVEIAPRGRRSVRVGYDGEVTTMQTPLRFRLIRAGLSMRVPSPSPVDAAVDAAAAS